MHKYLSAIHAGSTRERLRVQIPLVYTFNVFCFFYCQETIYGKALSVCVSPPGGGLPYETDGDARRLA